MGVDRRRLWGPPFGSSAQGSNGWGRKKAPAGTKGRRASAVSRAQSAARTAPALTRAGGRGRARRIRAQKGSRRLRTQAGGGAEGLERNGMRGRERYAGTEPQTFGDGMGNMTIHDTMQGSPMNRPPRLRWGCMHTSRLALYPVRPTARPRPAPRLFRRTRALLFVTPAPEPGSSLGSRGSLSGRFRFSPAAAASGAMDGPRLGGRGDGLGHMQRHATGCR